MGLASIRQHFLQTIALTFALAGCGRIGLELEAAEVAAHVDGSAGEGDDEPLASDAGFGDGALEADVEVPELDAAFSAEAGVEDAAQPVDESETDASSADASLPRDASVAVDASCVPGTCGCDVRSPPGLIAHFALDESSGTTARDTVGGRTGTLQNMSNAWLAGRLGNALDFDGVDDLVNVGSVANNVRALSFWLKADSFGITSTETGWLSPSSTGAPNNEWSNATRAYAKDGSSATAFIALLIVTKTQDWGGFNISVPATARGIRVKLDSGGLSLLSGTGVELSWNGGSSYTNAGYGGSGLIELGSNTTTFGGTNQLWGRASFSAGELSNASFRVRVRAGGLLGTASVDHLQVNVTHDSYTAHRNVMRLNNMQQVELAGQAISARGFPTGTQIYVDGALRSNVDTNFHHVVIVSPSNLDVSALQLGGVTGEPPSFDGVLDDVKLFNQPQTAADVRTLYTLPTCGL